MTDNITSLKAAVERINDRERATSPQRLMEAAESFGGTVVRIRELHNVERPEPDPVLILLWSIINQVESEIGVSQEPLGEDTDVLETQELHFKRSLTEEEMEVLTHVADFSLEGLLDALVAKSRHVDELETHIGQLEELIHLYGITESVKGNPAEYEEGAT